MDECPAYLAGHQGKLLKGLCRLLTTYIRWRINPWRPTYERLTTALEAMEKLLDG